ncbi:SAM-dependent methyltransferase [Paenibacillus luteus]|uniref:SAM-dependent methyltransferase n=1 Tax=Paenibacillus luteus TaxID=2545753 RepID=UPI001144B87D|nr:SAM-dependent methyltransferase [Paenibacillus luteus]
MSDNEKEIYRFSEAPIWELQRDYFEKQGIKAWQSDQVPQYITSNPYIATAYAEMIFGFLLDQSSKDKGMDLVTILELGAGSGRLAYHVLMELTALLKEADIELPPFRYVMSDLPLQNIGFWQQHERLLPFVKQGLLDFARFDAVQDTELHLLEAGVTVRPGDLEQPLLLIANYFFDSVPQELIYVDESKIYECRVSFDAPERDGVLAAADKLAQLVPSYHYYRAEEYERDDYPYREVIELYKQNLEDSHILFPTVGLSCLQRLRALSTAGFLLLTADKGDHRLENWTFAEPPKLIHHGSFSLTANYHALQYAFDQMGALTLFTKHHYRNLNVGCMLMLEKPESYVHTRLAYRRFIDRFGPDDFFSLKLWYDEHLNELELPQLLAFWRLSRFDSQLFLQSHSRMLELLPGHGEEEAMDLSDGIRMMWESFYPMNEPTDLALACANMLFQMEHYAEARVFYERSAAEHEASSETLYHLAICCYEMEDEQAASDYAQQILALEPDHEGAADFVLA